MSEGMKERTDGQMQEWTRGFLKYVRAVAAYVHLQTHTHRHTHTQVKQHIPLRTDMKVCFSVSIFVFNF